MKKHFSLLLAVALLLSVLAIPGLFSFQAYAEETDESGDVTTGEESEGNQYCTWDVVRFFGENRTETAFKIADAMLMLQKLESFDSIIIASGYNFADALTGSYLASAENAPILLYYGEASIAQNVDYITENLAPEGKVYILGGTAAVSQDMEDALAGFHVERIWGETRIETNLAILDKVGVTDQEILITTGWNYADALAYQMEYLAQLESAVENSVNKDAALRRVEEQRHAQLPAYCAQCGCRLDDAGDVAGVAEDDKARARGDRSA